MADNFLLKLYSLRRFKISREGCHGKDSHVSVPRWCQSSGHQKTLKCRKIQTQEISPYLKEQYPVTAHAPNFDVWTGCREIKRCEESKRVLKNPFASRLAGFNMTLKLLRIIGQ